MYKGSWRHPTSSPELLLLLFPAPPFLRLGFPIVREEQHTEKKGLNWWIYGRSLKYKFGLDCFWLIATYLVMTISRQITTGLSAILTVNQCLHVTVVKCIVKFCYQSLSVPSRQPRRETRLLAFTKSDDRKYACVRRLGDYAIAKGGLNGNFANILYGGGKHCVTPARAATKETRGWLGLTGSDGWSLRRRIRVTTKGNQDNGGFWSGVQTSQGERGQRNFARSHTRAFAASLLSSPLDKTAMLGDTGYRQPKKNYTDFIPLRNPERSLGYK